jgi:uncharacterized iron-regulated membrane protein
MLDKILHHPRKLWMRRAFFQVHLWAGILLAVYVIVIGISGSILVFQDEIRSASLQHTPLDPSRTISVDKVIDVAHSRFPQSRLTFISFPQQASPWWSLYLEDEHQRRQVVYADAMTGSPLEENQLLIDLILDLHIYLLSGETGFIVNCAMGIGLLLLALTGAVLWWPGVRLWKRGLLISLRRGWKRSNYDVHNAVGIWTLLIVSWWGLTAVYFLFPERVTAIVNSVSPLVGMKPPVPLKLSPNIAAVATLESILPNVAAISHGHLAGVALADKRGGDVTVYVDRRKPGDFSHRDILTFDGRSGRLLSVWHYGENHSLGDWFLWLMYPLHFGTLWGFGIKLLWAVLGFGVAVLSLTGMLMYWNRKLSKWIH